jgi:nucleotide-binding universal stress UspA family protein
MKVLLAVDGSTSSEAAVNAVAMRPWPAGTTIKVFSSIEPVFYPTTDTWVMPESYYEEMEKAGRESAEKAVSKAVDILRKSPISPIEITTEIRDGHAKDAILEEADAWGADLIVVGSHGYRGFKRFMLGSVSHAIATHAKCSVEIVRIPGAHAA